MNIREATVKDASEILLVMKNVEQSGFMLMSPGERSTNEADFEKFIEKLILHDQSAIFIAELDDNIAGYLILRGESASRTKHRAHLVVGVHSDLRKRGIAQSLFEYAFPWAKEKGIIKIESSVTVKNEVAYQLIVSTSSYSKVPSPPNHSLISGIICGFAFVP